MCYLEEINIPGSAIKTKPKLVKYGRLFPAG
jgi:hypothetical protein